MAVGDCFLWPCARQGLALHASSCCLKALQCRNYVTVGVEACFVSHLTTACRGNSPSTPTSGQWVLLHFFATGTYAQAFSTAASVAAKLPCMLRLAQVKHDVLRVLIGRDLQFRNALLTSVTQCVAADCCIFVVSSARAHVGGLWCQLTIQWALRRNAF